MLLSTTMIKIKSYQISNQSLQAPKGRIIFSISFFQEIIDLVHLCQVKLSFQRLYHLDL